MKGLCALLLGVLSMAATDWATIVKPVAKQVLRVETQKDGESGLSVCSGVVINAEAGFLLSAAHCFPGKPEALSITVSGRHAELARANRLLDLAIVRFSPKDERTMPLARESPGAGTGVAVIGFMLGAKLLHTQFGHIAARRSEDGAIVVDGVVLPGDSGGALMNEHGELVGVSNQYYQGTAVGLAVPVEIVRDFAEPYLPKAPKRN